MSSYFRCAILALIGLTAVGCGSQSTPVPASISSSKYQLSTEPQDAVGVLQFKESAKDGEPIVLVGRVGGGQKPWIDGRAAFLVVDDGVAPGCAEEEECGED